MQVGEENRPRAEAGNPAPPTHGPGAWIMAVFQQLLGVGCNKGENPQVQADTPSGTISEQHMHTASLRVLGGRVKFSSSSSRWFSLQICGSQFAMGIFRGRFNVLSVEFIATSVFQTQGVHPQVKQETVGEFQVTGKSRKVSWVRQNDGATVAERLVGSPPTKMIRVQSPAGLLWIFTCRYRARRCCLSAGFLWDFPFPPPLHSVCYSSFTGVDTGRYRQTSGHASPLILSRQWLGTDRGADPGFSHVGIMPDNAAGHRVFPGISCFLCSQDHNVKSRPNLTSLLLTYHGQNCITKTA
ncbi:hypothetical protein PR048_018907 [Dryococelus australis]|uniref:Uncharacterized protein n=1 Tax=Dryococelus australis TaxID=614101 RepID=A0ABQ9H228_9NEOP|nr:hypothetical protein PR048_018907 [Dryococelus australis]